MASMFELQPFLSKIGLSNPGQPVTGANVAPGGGFAFQDPTKGMGFFDQMKYYQQNNPDVLMNFAAGMLAGDTPGAIKGASSAMSDTRKEEKAKQALAVQQNSTYEWLISKGYSPDEAKAAINDPAVLKHLMSLTEAEWTQKMQEKYGTAASGKEFSGNLYYGVTRDGRTVPMSHNTSTGQLTRADGGDDAEIVERYGPGELAAAKEAGKIIGQTQANLPAQKLILDETTVLADQILNHPDLNRSIGAVDAILPDAFRAGVTDFRSRVKQLRGATFLAARAALKGGGQITDFEGVKAEEAAIRAEGAVNEDVFKQAIKDYKTHLENGFRMLQEQAAQGTTPNSMRSGSGGGGGPVLGGGGRILSTEKVSP